MLEIKHQLRLLLISEFRECFYLYARSGQIQTMDELTVVMRSLNMSPTISELRAYMKSKNGKVSFADFLDIMHQHSTKVIKYDNSSIQILKFDQES